MNPDVAVALGFAPHSGWAAVVGLGVAEGALLLAERARIEMADPGAPASRQPYHAVEGLPVSAAAKQLAAHEAQAASMAAGQTRSIVDRLAVAGRRVVGCGLLESSGRKGTALASVLASHALIHAADGDHFRNAIAVAADSLGLSVLRVPARGVEADVASVLGRTAASIQRDIQRLGRAAGPPWTADQKGAALVAWLVLAKQTKRSRRTDSGTSAPIE